jgi:hypothetical protein
MASATNIPVQQDGRVYAGLPVGIEPWFAQGACTGTGSGQIGVTIEFNPTSSRQFQKYVSINHVGITSTTAPLTDDVECLLRGANWEKAPVQSVFFALLEPQVTIDTNYMGDAWNDCFYAGRSLASTTGTIEIRTKDVNTAVARFSISGFVSDRPFIARNDWRV